MKSGKQRRAELDAVRQTKRDAEAKAKLKELIAGMVPVNRAVLAPHGSYSEPPFVIRGYYVNQKFNCIDCGKSEVWTPQQQKWWYEIAKGDVFTIARRCRPCRQMKREVKAAARARSGN